MVSGRDFYYTTAHSELWAGKDAQKEGNTDKVIVCARSACFYAIDFWLEFHQERNWGDSATSYLRNSAIDEDLPQEIREAASRLTNEISEVSHYFDPLDDAELIVEYFLDKKNLYQKGD